MNEIGGYKKFLRENLHCFIKHKCLMIEDLGGAWARLEDRLIDSELLKIFEEMGEIGGV